MDDLSITAYYNELVQNLVQEIKILHALKGNSNIVSYEDHQIITEDDGKKYTILIRMELLTPLNTYLADNKLSTGEIVKLGTDICRALEICEKHKIIHRDIKPDNIFVTKDGNFKLGDFGVARTMEKTLSAMSQKGTYTYMAPEVYYGKTYDKTVDLYSLGIVLYQLLNENRAPFLPKAPNPIRFSDRENSTKRRMSGEVLPSLSINNSSLNEIVLKVCDPNPENRFQTAFEMHKALESSINNKFSEKNDEEKKMSNEIDFDKTVSPFGNIPSNSNSFTNNIPEILPEQEIDFDKTVGVFSNIPESNNSTNLQPIQQHNSQVQQFYNSQANLIVKPQHKLFESYKLAWQNFANFKERARCSDYWNFVLSNIIIVFGLSLISAPLMAVVGFFCEIPLFLYWLAILIPSLSLLVRRLHDVGKEWYFIFLSLIPLVGSIILLVWCAGDGEKVPNKFGESPKYIQTDTQSNPVYQQN